MKSDMEQLKQQITQLTEDVKKINPKCSFPTIQIGDRVIVGYKEKEIKEALGL